MTGVIFARIALVGSGMNGLFGYRWVENRSKDDFI